MACDEIQDENRCSVSQWASVCAEMALVLTFSAEVGVATTRRRVFGGDIPVMLLPTLFKSEFPVLN